MDNIAGGGPRLPDVRPMGTMGTFPIPDRSSLRLGWKRCLSPVAPFLVRSVILSLLLHCAQGIARKIVFGNASKPGVLVHALELLLGCVGAVGQT
jgi:hypothetical protein